MTDLTTDALCASMQQVRALEWSPSKTSYTQANCVLGQYQITFLGEFECWQLSAPHKQGTDWKDGFTRHASKSAAKAAAQADYERRILAALTPAPQPTCRKCGGTMQHGRAIAQSYTGGAPDDLGGDAQTMSAGGPGVLIDCRKCEDCGWSVSADPQPEGDTGASIVCNRCGWEGDEDGLIATLDAEDGEPCRACPECRTDANLMDAHPPQPSVSVAEAAEVLLGDSAAIKTLVNFQLRHSASASDKARSMRHVQVVAALRALKGGDV